MASDKPGPYHKPIKVVSVLVNKKYVKGMKKKAQIISESNSSENDYKLSSM